MKNAPQEAYMQLTPAQAIAVIVFLTRAKPYSFEWQGVLQRRDAPTENVFQFHLPGGAKVYSSDQGGHWYVYCMNSQYTLSITSTWLREEVGLDVKCTAGAVRPMSDCSCDWDLAQDCERWLTGKGHCESEPLVLDAPAVRPMRLPDFSKDPAILKLHKQMGISDE